jgi:hypothetical protein
MHPPFPPAMEQHKALAGLYWCCHITSSPPLQCCSPLARTSTPSGVVHPPPRNVEVHSAIRHHKRQGICLPLSSPSLPTPTRRQAASMARCRHATHNHGPRSWIPPRPRRPGTDPDLQTATTGAPPWSRARSTSSGCRRCADLPAAANHAAPTGQRSRPAGRYSQQRRTTIVGQAAPCGVPTHRIHACHVAMLLAAAEPNTSPPSRARPALSRPEGEGKGPSAADVVRALPGDALQWQQEEKVREEGPGGGV